MHRYIHVHHTCTCTFASTFTRTCTWYICIDTYMYMYMYITYPHWNLVCFADSSAHSSPPGSSALEAWLPLWALPPGAALSTGVSSNIVCKPVISQQQQDLRSHHIFWKLMDHNIPFSILTAPICDKLWEGLAACCFLRFWPGQPRESLDRGTNPWLSSSAKALSLWHLMTSLFMVRPTIATEALENCWKNNQHPELMNHT